MFRRANLSSATSVATTGSDDAGSELSNASTAFTLPADPFNVIDGSEMSYVGHIRNAIRDQYTEHLAKTFAPGGEELDALKEEIYAAEQRGISWYAFLVAGITHLIYQRELPDIDLYLKLRLSYITELQRIVRHALKRADPAESDGVLLALNTLATHGEPNHLTPESMRKDDVQIRKKFGQSCDIDYYSRVRFDEVPWQVACELVEGRGGVKSLTQKNGLAAGIALADLISSWRKLERPKFESIFEVTDSVQRGQVSCKLGEDFSALTDNDPQFEPLVLVMQRIRLLLELCDPPIEVPDLDWRRHSVLHELLSIPGFPDQPLYETCRVACLAFMQLVLYPLSTTNDMAIKVLLQLLRNLDLLVQGRKMSLPPTGDPSLISWAVIMAIMLAMEHYRVTGVCRQLDQASELLISLHGEVNKVDKGGWGRISCNLKPYLWLESDCDERGLAAWNYACLRRKEK